MDTDITCPHCHRLDFVQSVPALYADGVSTSSGSNLYSGVGVSSNGLVPVFGTATVERTHTTALARSLAREPAERPAGRCTAIGVLILVLALLALGPAFAGYATIDPETRGLASLLGVLILPVAIAIPALLVLGAAASRRRHNRRIERGRPIADAVWRAAFYCHRCGAAFWPQPPAPEIPSRQPFAPQHFRWLVWNAGGYANV